jgi:adenosylcobinamide kinase/adenosylcobinamide-phosphate guanylyltransferase
LASPSHVLVLGGQRSGKSRFAESIVGAGGMKRIYIATATAGDDEMARRIATHRARRDEAWTTLEEPLELASAIARSALAGHATLVDCLTLWLSNLMEAGRTIESETDALIAALEQAAGPVVLVSNEVGGGIIPDNALARRFAEAQGLLNQRVAATIDRVVLMTAGIPLLVKPPADRPFSL